MVSLVRVQVGDSELGELVEWLIQQIANLSMRKRCVGSIPTLSAKLISRASWAILVVLFFCKYGEIW